MNEFFYITFLLLIAFISSLLYLAKEKKATFLSYLLNLNLEYIILGILLSYITLKTDIKMNYDFKPYLSFVFFLTGVLFGGQYKFSLLKSINYKFHIFLLLIYTLLSICIYILSTIFRIEHLFIPIILNTTFPFSAILLNKITKNNFSNNYTNLILISLYPFYSFIFYSLLICYRYYDIINFVSYLLVSICVIIIISKSIQFNDKRAVYTLNITLLVLFTGLTVTFKLSPISSGFIIGLLISNTKFGDVFINTIDFLDKFLYIILFIIIGFYLFNHINLDLKLLIFTILTFLLIIFIRKYVALYLYQKMVISSKESINLVNIGILPMIFLIELNSYQFRNLLNFIPYFFLLFLMTEIYNYRVSKNENN